STQGMHRTPSTPRSTHLTPPAPVPTVDKEGELILQDTLQVSLFEHKIRQEQEARENVALVEEHLAPIEIEKMVKGQENVVDDSLIPRNAEHNIPSTRLKIKSDKECPEVEFTDVVIPVNVYDEEEEEDKITDVVYELKRREKGKNVEESRITLFPTPIRSPRIHTDLVSSDTEKLQELTVTTSSLSNTNRLLSLFKTKPARFKRYKSLFQELQGRYRYLFEHLRAKFMPRKSFVTLVDHLHEVMADSLPNMVDKHIKEQVPEQVPQTTCKTPVVRLRDQDDPYDDAHPDGENSAKRQKTSEYEAYVSGESSSGQDNVHKQVMADSLPNMVDKHIKEQVPEQVRNQVPVYVTEGLILERQKNKEEMEKITAKAILQERGNIQA
nr:hypothetical protein [Tanacetum cinerariifolium]